MSLPSPILRLRRLRPEAVEPLPLPAAATPGAAGLDLMADLPAPLRLPPGEWSLLPTGFSVEIPEGYEGQVRPRSGLAFAHGVTVLNAPGTIDADYRGEVKVLLINLGKHPFEVTRGMRIAQLVIAPVCRVTLVEVSELAASSRGEGGFGSTGA
ncbi:MAG: dUTP diphosphatase [Myxococcota bacterium]|nr:dUTP diphosphatase [Myxococcota bacterium]